MFDFYKTRITGLLAGLGGKPLIENAEWTVTPEELGEITILYPREYNHPEAETWLEPLLSGWRNLVRVKRVDLPQPYQRVALLKFITPRNSSEIAIDYSDYPEINETVARRVAVYFKMQYDAGGYGFENVIPGGYVTDSWRLYWNLRRIQRVRDEQRFDSDVYGRFGLSYAGEIRGKAVDALRSQKSFRFEGGLEKVGYKYFF